MRAAPVEGAANDALLRLLAEELGVPRSLLRLERGANARLKLVRVDGVDATTLAARWPGLVTRTPPADTNAGQTG